MAKGYIRPGFCSTSPQGISNSSINCLVKTFSQAEWALMKGPFIHFALTDHDQNSSLATSGKIR